MMILGLDHVQLAMPPGREDDARAFYTGALGLTEVPKPAALAGRGGAWFTGGSARVHLGVETPFRPARKAHPAFVVDDLAATITALRERGCTVPDAEPLERHWRTYVHDPFGNRIELMSTAT